MRTTFILATLALLAIPTYALADPHVTQYLENGSFETWTTTVVPDGWVIESGTVTKSTVQIEGVYSAQFNVRRGLLGEYSASLTQTIPRSDQEPIVPEAYYDLSFDAFANFNGGLGWANATIYWFGIDGNNYATTIYPLDMIETPEFRRYSVRTQAPIAVGNVPLVATVEFNLGSVRNSNAVTMWVDGVIFGAGSPVG